jgi:hypothetical protein
LEGAVQESTAAILTIQATFPNDVPEKTAESALTGGPEAIEDPGKIAEAASIAGVVRNGESVRSAAEKTENAAAQ